MKQITTAIDNLQPKSATHSTLEGLRAHRLNQIGKTEWPAVAVPLSQYSQNTKILISRSLSNYQLFIIIALTLPKVHDILQDLLYLITSCFRFLVNKALNNVVHKATTSSTSVSVPRHQLVAAPSKAEIYSSCGYYSNKYGSYMYEKR